MVAVLILLIPIENKRKLHEQYGKLAEYAETDERSAYILEHVDEYPREMLDYYYMNDEFIDIVYNYIEHKDDYKSMSFTDEELNSGTIPNLYMEDYRWCYESIGGRPIFSGGCAVVSISMISLGLSDGTYYDPVQVSRKAEEVGASGFMGGVRNSEIGNVLNAVELQYNSYNFDPDEGGSGAPDEEQMKEILDKGRPLLLNFKGETFGSHSLVIRGYDENGFILNDPASEEKSAKTWTFDELAPEILRYWEVWKE
ncbi:MAG: C39 family peptidase [Oscillospiraceae bacterium]